MTHTPVHATPNSLDSVTVVFLQEYYRVEDISKKGIKPQPHMLHD